MIAELVMVGIGGGYGALIRLAITNYCKANFKSAYLPYWTLLINIIGTWILALFIRINLEHSLYIFLGAGGLGGFTTFSTFNYEIASMFLDREYVRLAIHFLGTYIFSILGAIIIIGYGR